MSPFRKGQGEATRKAIIDAALTFIAEGNFRPEAKAVAARAGIDKSAVTRHFGSIDLLYRVIARECWVAVVAAANLRPGDDRQLAWLIMVGTRPEAP